MISTVVARDAVEALPEKLVAVRVDVDGLYVTAVFVRALVVPAPVANSNGKFVLALEEVIPMFVADEALPVKVPTNSLDVNVPVKGEYDNAFDEVSRYNV